ncbi:uncharacterized protein CcaverHIS019_0107440 [Cutaneotrichosporon cavernicola]|uniref:Uncharacterized protein n=1 Tax=Cutaneotrichosporon cavernicola TaxID=279322 RepID=A0AA48KYX4_9TREE|nr:uncharacterized protein CcaverHIS019_0107440 [Cutaneotrichosporon cavernicola]BEI88026.1 hypothetical protein CcaverHIS019_0107440 [Cutaneotrichosporon cavernicola]
MPTCSRQTPSFPTVASNGQVDDEAVGDDAEILVSSILTLNWLNPDNDNLQLVSTLLIRSKSLRDPPRV